MVVDFFGHDVSPIGNLTLSWSSVPGLPVVPTRHGRGGRDDGLIFMVLP
jgi:hypothetical protein